MKKKYLKIIMLLVSLFVINSANAQIQVRAGSVETEEDTITVPVFVDNFNNVASLSLTLDFDSVALSFIDYQKTATFSTGLVANVVDGKLLVAWFSLNPVSVTTDTLVRLRFTRGAGCSSTLVWNLSSPGTNQLTDLAGTTLNTTFTDGVLSFLVEDYPNLISPVDNNQNTFLYQRLTWDVALCYESFHLQVATDTGFTNLVIDSLNLQDTTFIPTNLVENAVYHWRVGKIDARDSTYWSNSWSFTTGELTTAKVNLGDERLYVDTIMMPVVLDSLLNVTEFDLWLSYDETETDLMIANTSTLNNLNISDTSGWIRFSFQSDTVVNLISDTLAYLTFVQKGCETPLIWDTINSSFSYYGAVEIPSVLQDGYVAFLDSSAVNLTFPANNATQVFFQPTLTWNAIECTQDFRLEMALDAGFTNVVLDTLLMSDTAFTPLFLTDTTTYYWRVYRIDNENTVFVSPIWNFTTEQVILVETKVYSEHTYGNDLLVPVTIENIENVVAFDLILDYDNTVLGFVGAEDTTALLSNVTIVDLGNQIKISWNSADSTLATTANILNDTLVKLRFSKVGNCYSNLTWNAASHYTHFSPLINVFSNYQDAIASFLTLDKPTALTPANNVQTLLYTRFDWTTAACVVEYQLQVATDMNFTNVVLDTLTVDTTFFATNLQSNTTYYWRTLKLDTENNSFSSDTLTFTTGDAYETYFEIENQQTDSETMAVPVVIDSLFWANGLQLTLNYNDMAIEFNGVSDTLLSNIVTQSTNGNISISWLDNMPVDLVDDTLVVLHFTNIGTCETMIDWQNTTVTYVNSGINRPFVYTDATLTFENTDAVDLYLPPNLSYGPSATPTLRWKAEDCTIEYQLMVATDTFFTNVIVDTIGMSDTLYTFKTLLSNGDYYWKVARINEQDSLYWSDTWNFKVSGVPTVEVLKEDLAVLVFPNPFEHQLNLDTEITSKDKFLEVSIYSVSGQLLHQEHFDQVGRIQETLYLNQLTAGLYFMHLRTNQRIETVKILKR